MPENDPYLCCGGHRDTPFCPMCGRRLPIGSPEHLNHGSAYIAHFASLGLDLTVQFTRGGIIVAKDEDAAVVCEWDPATKSLRAKGFQSPEGETTWGLVKACVWDHQLWPFEPKAIDDDGNSFYPSS